jgi:ABC-type lipoprotein release transport system permease subunit
MEKRSMSVGLDVHKESVSVVLLAVAGWACLVPALRASRIDPMLALQHE